MARRPRQDEERSMDSLMDAMTNVVGILLLILVVFSLQITTKIEEQLADLPNITEQQLQEMKESRDKTLDNLNKLQATYADAESKKIDPDEAQQLALNLKDFEKENEDLADKTSDLEALQAKLKELEPKKDDKQVRNTEAVTELNRLEQLLAAKPELEEVAAREITLPDPRVADDQAYIYYVACKHQKVYVIGEPYQLMVRMRDILDQNYQTLAYSGTDVGSFTHTIRDPKAAAKDEISDLVVPFQARTRRDKEAIAFLNGTSVKSWGADTSRTMMQVVMGGSEDAQEQKKEIPFRKMRFDREKIKKFFEASAGKGDFTYIPQFGGDTVRLELKPNETGGITVDQLNGSAYVEMIRQAKLNRRVIVYFYVAPDSFDIYLRARAYVDSQQIAAGWRLWEGEVISDLKPNKKRQTVPYAFQKIKTENYQKIAQFVGPKQAEVINQWVDNFESEFAALEMPKEVEGETIDEYKQRLREARIQQIREATRDLKWLFEAPLTATVSVRETEAGVIGEDPPRIMHIRTFKKRELPKTLNPPKKPASNAGKTEKKPDPKIILD